jgi:hypothetical protein
MKNSIFFLVLGLALMISACGGKHGGSQGTGAQQETPAQEQTGPEYTSAYICPMYCPGSGSDGPGKCPKCGMDYVKNEKAGSEMPGHEGHNH